MNSAGQGRPGDPYGDKPDTYQLGYPTVALKPCPFCGSSDVYMREITNYRDYALRGIYCRGCGMFCANWKNDEHRIKTWNRRVNG